MGKNYDSIKYIQNPSEKVQEESVKISYDALRYIKSPSFNAQLLAVKNNESAVRLMHDINRNKVIEFLKINILVIKHIPRDIQKEINLEDLQEIIKEVLSSENVKEKYVRDFLNCTVIDRNSETFPMDKILFIYKYGSKKAKKIAVDEKLKIM